MSEFNVTKTSSGYIINNKWLEKILNGEQLKLVVPYNIESSNDEKTIDDIGEPDLMAVHINSALQGLSMSMKHSDRSTFFAYTFGGNPLYGLSEASSEDALLDKLVNDIVRVIENEVKVTKFMKDNKVSVQYLGSKELKDGFAGMISNPENIGPTDIAQIKSVVRRSLRIMLIKLKN